MFLLFPDYRVWLDLKRYYNIPSIYIKCNMLFIICILTNILFSSYISLFCMYIFLIFSCVLLFKHQHDTVIARTAGGARADMVTWLIHVVCTQKVKNKKTSYRKQQITLTTRITPDDNAPEKYPFIYLYLILLSISRWSWSRGWNF